MYCSQVSWTREDIAYFKVITEYVNWVSWIAQPLFAAFGKGLQLFSETPYDETQKLSKANLVYLYTCHLTIIIQCWT